MRTPLILLFVLASLNSFSQKDVYNTTINKANIVNVKDGKVTIGQIIINPSLKTKLVLIKHTQKKDSLNNIYTEFVFKNPETLPTFGIDISVKLDQPCDTAYFGYEGMAMGIMDSRKLDKTEYKITIDQLSINGILWFRVVSRKRINIKIEGVGIVN